MKTISAKAIIGILYTIAGLCVEHWHLTGSSLGGWGAILLLATAAIGHWLHNPGAVVTPGPVVNPPAQAGLQAGVRMLGLLFLAMVGLLFFLLAGCTTNPSKSHVIRVVATGTKFGVTQNPTTGIYELGIQRVQTEVTTIPVFLTNGVFSIPDVVSRYEVSTHSAVFGNAALTSTMATGSNAVVTEVGGKTAPINAGVGTGSNLTPLSH